MEEAGDDCYNVIKIDTSNKANLRSLKNMYVGFVAAAELRKKPGSEKDRLEFRQACKRFILTIIDKLKQKSPLNHSLARNLSCLDPMEIINKTDLCESKFRKVLRLMVDIRRMKITDCDATKEQFSTFARAANNVPEVRVFDKAKSRLDKLYYSVMGTNEEYKKVWSVVRKQLLFSHGQASVESSFSINKKITTQNLSEDTNCEKIYKRLYSSHRRSKKSSHYKRNPQFCPVSAQTLLPAPWRKEANENYKGSEFKTEALRRHPFGNEKETKGSSRWWKMLNAEVDKLYTEAEAKPSKSYKFVLKANGMRQKAKDKAAEIDHLEEGINQKKKELLNMRWLSNDTDYDNSFYAWCAFYH